MTGFVALAVLVCLLIWEHRKEQPKYMGKITDPPDRSKK